MLATTMLGARPMRGTERRPRAPDSWSQRCRGLWTPLMACGVRCGPSGSPVPWLAWEPRRGWQGHSLPRCAGASRAPRARSRLVQSLRADHPSRAAGCCRHMQRAGTAAPRLCPGCLRQRTTSRTGLALSRGCRLRREAGECATGCGSLPHCGRCRGLEPASRLPPRATTLPRGSCQRGSRTPRRSCGDSSPRRRPRHCRCRFSRHPRRPAARSYPRR